MVMDCHNVAQRSRLWFRCGIIRRIIPQKSSRLIYTFILVWHKTTMNY